MGSSATLMPCNARWQQVQEELRQLEAEHGVHGWEWGHGRWEAPAKRGRLQRKPERCRDTVANNAARSLEVNRHSTAEQRCRIKSAKHKMRRTRFRGEWREVAVITKRRHLCQEPS